MLATSFALALAVAAGPAARAESRIATDEGQQIEILDQPVPVGRTIELPEGFIRVEEEGTEDREVGSFAVVPAASLTATAAAVAARPPAARAADAQPAPAYAVAPERARFLRVPGDGACRAERSAYLRDLWKMSGIDVSDPDALLLGLDAGEGARAGFYWFALAADPFRPLAWSSDLRARADALARCVREQLR